MIKSGFAFMKYLDPSLMYSTTMGIRVNLENHMCLCGVGLGF